MIKKYIIVDIDETLCNTPKVESLEEYHDLNHIDFKPLKKNIDYIKSYIDKNPNLSPIFITARCESLRSPTLQWLYDNIEVEKYIVLMRPLRNTNPDGLLKEYLYKIHVAYDTNHIDIWFDDNLEVIEHCKKLGINIVDVNNLTGENVTEEFKKFDTDKLDLTLVPTTHNKHYASIAQMGERKYGRNNWKQAKVEDVRRYYAAMQRHQMAELDGQYLDPESGMPHGWHALWNRSAINYFVEKFGYEEVFKYIS